MCVGQGRGCKGPTEFPNSMSYSFENFDINAATSCISSSFIWIFRRVVSMLMSVFTGMFDKVEIDLNDITLVKKKDISKFSCNL